MHVIYPLPDMVPLALGRVGPFSPEPQAPRLLQQRLLLTQLSQRREVESHSLTNRYGNHGRKIRLHVNG